MKSICFALLLLLATSFVQAADPPEEGKLIFNTRCAGCHNVNKVLTGPALGGVLARHSVGWIVRFVQSSQSMVKAGDKDAIKIFEQFNRVPMPDHPDITEQQITAILDYVRAETKEVTEKKPFAIPGKRRPDYRPVPLSSVGIYLAYIGLVFLLSGVLMLFVRVKAIERQAAYLENDSHVR